MTRERDFFYFFPFSPQGGRPCFQEMIVHRVWVTLVGTNTHGPPGSNSVSQSQPHVPPPAHVLVLAPRRGRACRLKPYLGFSTVCRRRLIWNAVFHRGWKWLEHRVILFRLADGVCINPCGFGAVCQWLAVIEHDNHPLSPQGRCLAVIMLFAQFSKCCNQS